MNRRKNWLRALIVNGFAVTMSFTAMRTAADAQQVTTPLTERERLLLERIEQLERRLSEVEARVALTAASNGNGAAAVRAPAPIAAASPARDQDVETSEQRGVKLVPHAVLVGSATYNTYGLIPGSIAFYGVPRLPGITGRQFSISAGNTFVGTDIVG